MFLNKTNRKSFATYFTPLMKFNKKFVLGYLIAVLLFTSCVPFKEIQLLQETAQGEYEINKPTTEYTIKKSDLLHVDVKFLQTSTKDYFNSGGVQGLAGGGSGAGSPMLYLSDYLVDTEGNIDLPALGKFYVVGKTTQQVAKEIEAKLVTLQKFNAVTVKLTNFKVTMIGEIRSPGTQYIYEQHYHLLHAISNAGGFTDFGNRKRVRLIRETEKGFKTFWFDFTDPKVVSSENFYLQPNDVVYIEPLKAKATKSNVQNISIGLSIISIITTLAALLTRP